MRTLFITQDYPPGIGGIQTYSLEHASRLSRYCDDFLLICPGKGETVDDSDDSAGFEIRRLKSRSHLLMLPLCRALPGILRERRFDVSFHAQWQTALPAIRARNNGQLGKVCVAAHARELLYNPYHYLPGIGRAYERYRSSILQQVDHFFPVSGYTEELLHREGVSRDKLTVVRNGTDPALFRPLDASGLRTKLGLEGKRIMLTVTRLVRRKGIDTVLTAMAQLGSDYEDLHYLIVGTGPEEAGLRQLSKRLGLTLRVHFLGPANYKELPHYYNLSDLFVMSSRTELPDVEGFGIVFLEANACEVPVIGTRSGGIPSAILEGETGLIVHENSPVELEGAIRSLLLQPERMAEMGRRGRKRVEEELSWDRLSGRLYEQLESVCQNPSHSGTSARSAVRGSVSGGSAGRPKRVLMIAPYFLPRRRVGSMRPSRFAAHLSLYGWEPHVISLDSREKLTDREVEWLRGVTVHRVDPGLDRTEIPNSDSGSPGSEDGSATLFSGVGDYIDRHCPMDTWFFLFFKELSRIREIAVQTGADLVWSTGDPWSGHWLASQIVQQLNCPWVVDFRDPWTLGGVQLRERSWFSRAADRKLERSFLSRADRVTFTSDRTREMYTRHYPMLTGRAVTITNSFDRFLIQKMPAAPSSGIDPEPLSLLFFGTFRPLSPAEPLIKILHHLKASAPRVAERINVYSTGNLEREDEQLAERLGVLEMFQKLDPVPPEQGAALLKEADLLFLSTDPRREHIIPAKLWDYLSVDRPVLSIAPNPEIGNILKRTGAGVQFLPSETEKVSHFLAESVRSKEKGTGMPIRSERNESEIRNYESQATTRQLANLFDSLHPGR
ncbi:MAG: glycosyltransferase [Balneolaceae bacterium]